MNRRLIVAATCLLVLAVVAVVIILKPVPFSVGLQPGSVNYPMMHTIQGGFFERQGLKPKVTVFRSANDALDALLGGKVFLDAVIPIQNIAAVENQQPGSLGIVALLISDSTHPLDYLMVSKDSDIRTASDLAGKTLVVFPGSYSETMTQLTLKKLGVEEVKFIKRAPSDMPQALLSGEADAGIFYDPVATKAASDGWARIIQSGFWEEHLLPELVVGGYTYNKVKADQDPALARKSIDALRNGILDARAKPEEAKSAIGEYLGAFHDILSMIPNSRVELSDEVDPGLIKKTLQLYYENGIIEQPADLSNALYKP